MNTMTLGGHMGTVVTVDACVGCQVFWFDTHESLKLTPGATLQLFQLIGERPASARVALSPVLKCPRCAAQLSPTHDRQRDTRFEYSRCRHAHGRLITFFDFLKEKDFIRPLSGEQLAALRQNVTFVHCSNCGAPIDLAHASACGHCGAAMSILDVHQAERLVAQLRGAAADRPIDPALPLRLIEARRQVDYAFGAFESGRDWWSDASNAGLVEAGVRAMVRWWKRSEP